MTHHTPTIVPYISKNNQSIMSNHHPSLQTPIIHPLPPTPNPKPTHTTHLKCKHTSLYERIHHYTKHTPIPNNITHRNTPSIQTKTNHLLTTHKLQLLQTPTNLTKPYTHHSSTSTTHTIHSTLYHSPNHHLLPYQSTTPPPFNHKTPSHNLSLQYYLAPYISMRSLYHNQSSKTTHHHNPHHDS